jgi:hypothetical protein
MRKRTLVVVAALTAVMFVGVCEGAFITWSNIHAEGAYPIVDSKGAVVPGTVTFGTPLFSNGALVQLWKAMNGANPGGPADIDDPNSPSNVTGAFGTGAGEGPAWKIDDVLLDEVHCGYGTFMNPQGTWSQSNYYDVSAGNTIYVRAYNVPKPDWAGTAPGEREVGIRNTYGQIVYFTLTRDDIALLFYFDDLRTRPFFWAWYVDAAVPQSGSGTSWETAFKTIQEGIDAACDRAPCAVVVAEGTYVENIQFAGKIIVLRSTDPLSPLVVANTIIDGNQSGPVVTFSGTENQTCVLSGFTICNGWARAGGGVLGGSYENRSCATIQNNIITGNSAAVWGGGLAWCGGTIQNNTITGNSAAWGGGLAGCDGTVQDNRITRNSANEDGGGLSYCDGTIQKNTITGNSAERDGGGLWFCNGTIQSNTIGGNTSYYDGGGLHLCLGTIESNTITGNSAGHRGGGLSYCDGATRSCIIWGNAAPQGPQLWTSSEATYCCIQGWTGGGQGNITANPQFVDPDGPDNNAQTYEDNDYHLAVWSPCIDVGKNEDWMWQAVDLDGNPRVTNGIVDIGAYEHSGSNIGHYGGLVVEADASGRGRGPLPGATVTLVGEGGATTNGQGEFLFKELTPGVYSATVSKSGYYSVTRSVSVRAGETKHDVFYLAAQSGGSQAPGGFDFASPNGKHFIEGMPGSLSFGVTVAWNGSPGSVRYFVGGNLHNATITDLGGGLARATLTLPVPSSISACSELTIQVTNGEGYVSLLNTGVYFDPLPDVVSAWYGSSINWMGTGASLTYSQEGSMKIWEAKIPTGDFSSSASVGYTKELEFDALAGTLRASLGGFGKFDAELDLPEVELLGEGRLDLTGGFTVAFGGLETSTVSPFWELSFSGKAGVGAPAVLIIDILFPPAAPVVHGLLKVPVVKDVLKALKLRLYLIGGGSLSGEYAGGQTGDCFLGTTSLSGSLTVGLEGQVVLELWGAEAGVYAGGTGTPEFQICPEFEFKGVTIRAYVGVFASAWLFEFSQEVGAEIHLAPSAEAQALRAVGLSPQESGTVWRPIGSSHLQWGETNRVADGDPDRRLDSHPLDATGVPLEEAVVENVTGLASPSIRTGASDTLVLFSLHDPEKPWYAATDIATVRRTGAGPWSLERIADDLDAEFSPTIAQARVDKDLATWTRVSGDVSGATEPQGIPPHLEIVAAWFDHSTGLWSTPEQLTSNEVVDRDPLAVVFGETRGILWIQNEADGAIGDAQRGDHLMFAEWTGSEWAPAQTLWSGPNGILHFSFVADGEGDAHVVFSVDQDGDLETRSDRELYALSRADGLWQAALRLTEDGVEDALPALVAPSGAPMCVWSCDGTLLYSLVSQLSPAEVYSEYTLANEAPTLDAVTLPGGAAVAYAVQGPSGVDIVAAFYDVNLDKWSLPRQLTSDEHAETALSLDWDGTSLAIAYLKTQTLRTDMDVEIDGEIHHLENVPHPGRTDLCMLRYALANDLAIRSDSLSVDPPNPASGFQATVRATIENRGDVPVQDVQVAFYDGDPGNGGVMIGNTITISEVLIAGGTKDVVVAWDVPSAGMPREVFVVVDPALALDDSNRANNTMSKWTVLPDLVIESSWSTEVSGNVVSLTARVVNEGAVPTGAFAVSWRLGAPDGREVGSTPIESLDVGGAYEATCQWKTDDRKHPREFMPVYAIADPANLIGESQETNNSAFQAVRVALYEEPRVTSVHYETAGLTLLWWSEPGNRYRIWQSADLSTWSALPAIIESEGDSSSWTDDTATQVRQRFYRIELLP